MNQTKDLTGPCSECGQPIRFPAESAGMMSQCPHCGRQTELLLGTTPQEPAVPRELVVWTIVALLILALGLAGAIAALNRAERWAAQHKEKVSQPARP